MKVALVTHCYFPNHVYGTEVLVAIMARELAALGHEPVVISAVFEGEPRQATPIVRYEWDGVPVVSIDKNAFPARELGESYDQPAMQPVYLDLLRGIRPDVVHVFHIMNHTTALLDAAAVLGIPLVATLTDFFGVCLNHRLETAAGALCTGPNALRSNCMACHIKAEAERTRSGRWSMANASALRPVAATVLAASGRYVPRMRVSGFRPSDVTARPERLARAFRNYRAAIAPTSFLRDIYEANRFPVPLHVVHFGLDIDRRPKPPPPDEAVTRLAFMGQIAPHKGLHIVLEALRRVAAPHIHLTVWGDTAQDPAYMAHLRSLAEGLPVRFAGRFPRERVADVLAEADAALIPSLWYENSPQSLMEALATHTPVIVTDMPGLTEFVRPSQNGFIVKTGDVASMQGVLADIAGRRVDLRGLSLTTAYPRTTRDMALQTLALYPASPGPEAVAIAP
ncbi:MAG: glycosyltransferase [Alphaproteobacteria bacterium]|nr:glycosyltransferase [Alphaproteobacteria bacterium]